MMLNLSVAPKCSRDLSNFLPELCVHVPISKARFKLLYFSVEFGAYLYPSSVCESSMHQDNKDHSYNGQMCRSAVRLTALNTHLKKENKKKSF